MEFTREEKLKEIAREIALRRRVYPNRVLTRRLTQQQAERQKTTEDTEMNEEHKRGLLKRIHRLATPSPWGWEDRELLVEVLETLIEEITKQQGGKHD